MSLRRRHLTALGLAVAVWACSPVQAVGMDAAQLAGAMAKADALPRLRALIVARHGTIVAEKAFRGPGLDVPVNVKSVSKSVIAALVGIAIDRGVLQDPDQRIAALLPDRLPAKPDPRLGRLTVGHLLSMQAGLERTSGRNYGRWVQSRDWVRHVLSRPFVDEPGGGMLYSTGDWHVLSAVLTRAAGRSTHALARAWLGRPLGIRVPAWERDPQGVFLGGNNMLLSPRAMLRFAELYRNGGRHAGRQVLPEAWVARSWTARTVSPFSSDAYGYGWFLTRMCGLRVAYARGFGGQFIFVVPAAALSVVMTSETTTRTRVGGYRQALLSLLRDDFITVALRADGKRCNG